MIPTPPFAAIEAVIGLIIEVSFIATFTQRFFGTLACVHVPTTVALAKQEEGGSPLATTFVLS